VKATGCKRDWYKGRLPVWMRGLVVLVIGWAVFLCGQQVADGYRATMAYRDAPVCDVGDRGGNGNDSVACVRLETGMVLDRWTSWECTSNGTSHDGGRTCTTYYEIKVEWPDGADWLRVPSHMYDQAKKGDRAEVRLWRGEVVGWRYVAATTLRSCCLFDLERCASNGSPDRVIAGRWAHTNRAS